MPTRIESDPMQADGRPENTGGFRTLPVCILAGVLGIAAGFVAYILYNLIGFFTNLFFFQRFALTFVSPQLNTLGPWVIGVPVVGGLIIGLMIRYGSPKIRGHGIPEAMEAVLVNRSRIEPKVAILKPLSAAIAIGTGGPFGAEGPIIQTGGAIGSLAGQLFHTTAAERKTLLACGAAAGMSATFNTPIAGVILAIELLLFEFKSRSFIPLVIASTLATTVRFALLGRSSMFEIGPVDFGIPDQLPFYLALGAICGAAAVGLTKLLYWIEDQFNRLPVDPMWWPAIGALALGVIGFFVPRVFGVGYDTISDILNDRLTLDLLVAILVFKCLALVISIGSGTSGGLLAPTFMSSAALGAVFAHLINQIFPAAHLSPGAYALVAMAAVFGAASRATFTFIIFAFEITRDYNAILPLMLVSVIADGIALVLMPNSSIMTEKLVRRGLRVHQDYETDVLRHVRVGEVMKTQNIPTIPASMSITHMAQRITRAEPKVAAQQALFVLDQEGCLAGILARSDLLRFLEEEPGSDATVLDIAEKNLVVTYPDEMVYDALIKMLRYDVGRLPVVERERPDHLIGFLGRSGVLAAWLRRLEDENVREPGLIRSPARN